MGIDIAKLAARWNDRMLADVSAPLTARVIESGSLLREGAANSEIVAAEQRLGVSLPDSYRQFLQHSNGAYADWDLIEEADPRSATSDPSLGLLPAGDLVPVSEAVGETIDIWMEVAPDLRESYNGRPHRNGEDVLEIGPLAESILVSSLTSEGGKYFLCLAPTGPNTEGDDAFELWDQGHSETTRYLSFADWLELSVSDHWYDPGTLLLNLGTDLDPGFIEEQRTWPVSLRVQSARRLVQSTSSTKLGRVLDSLWRESDPFIRLAAAQVHRVATDREDRLVELLDCDEPSVALSATASLRVLTQTQSG